VVELIEGNAPDEPCKRYMRIPEAHRHALSAFATFTPTISTGSCISGERSPHQRSTRCADYRKCSPGARRIRRFYQCTAMRQALEKRMAPCGLATLSRCFRNRRGGWMLPRDLCQSFGGMEQAQRVGGPPSALQGLTNVLLKILSTFREPPGAPSRART
jgi:hypothetical protein